jgi:hypothetical protein
MADVIDLSRKKKIKGDLARQDKLQGLLSLVRCSSCGAKCAKCGAHSDDTRPVRQQNTDLRFILCGECHEEWLDLLDYLEAGRKRPRPFWFNREWARQWMAWLDYQWSLVNYVSSPEVLEALTNLEDE